MSEVNAFNEFRARMNERILGSDSTLIKRMYNLDTNAFKGKHLPTKTKELAGLSASMVLRCDDCIKYHIQSGLEAGATEEELVEIFEIALLIGGTIVIPHLRRAFAYMDEVLEKTGK